MCGSAKATRGSAASERPFVLSSIALYTLFRNCSLTASCAMPAVTVTACQSSCLFDGRHHWGILTGIHGNAAPSVRDTLPFKLPDDGVSIKKKTEVCEEVVLEKHRALFFIVIKEESRSGRPQTGLSLCIRRFRCSPRPLQPRLPPSEGGRSICPVPRRQSL